MPLIDESQDWELHYAHQNATHTIMKFSRPYLTCDKEFDMKITDSTMRLIFAYHDEDPRSPEHIQMHKHVQRGSKSLVLLAHPKPFDALEEDAKIWEVRIPNVTIPHDQQTIYHCFMLKSPFKGK